jgi:hypothetical protein
VALDHSPDPGEDERVVVGNQDSDPRSAYVALALSFVAREGRHGHPIDGNVNTYLVGPAATRLIRKFPQNGVRISRNPPATVGGP